MGHQSFQIVLSRCMYRSGMIRDTFDKVCRRDTDDAMALGGRDLFIHHVATRLCQFTPATMEALSFLQHDMIVLYIPMPCGSGLDD
jgi:hypothetical protein